jgi:hypothetical protein
MTDRLLDLAEPGDRTATPVRDAGPCDLYAPGHQMHYTHQGRAVRSPATPVANVVVDGADVTLVLEGGRELAWRHHDTSRLRRALELVPSKRVAYPDQHALRVGPYWFNCAAGSDAWQDCSHPVDP